MKNTKGTLKFCIRSFSGFFVLILLNLGTAAHADQITLFAYSSPRPMHWENPRSLFVSALENELLSFGSKYAHSIGHVNVELQCDGDDQNDEVLDYAGMTSGKGYNPISLIFRGYGMGVLFQNFPGELEKPEKVKKEILHGEKSGRMNFVKFLISSKTCRRLHQYFIEYQERDLSRNYGLPNRPRYGEGAGCSAFGTSFLEVAGLLREDLVESWSKELEISDSLIGGPITGEKISVRKILFSHSSWQSGSGQDPNRVPAESGTKNLFFWEPNAIYQWVNQGWKNQTPEDFERANMGKALGLVTDARNIPTPEDPIWKY